ncbi:MAG: hypothetical protein ACRDFQ_00755 [Anaerolineales bacterium]
MNNRRKRALVLFVLITGVALLAGCTGRTVIDVNIDPTTGVGDIIIQPQATEPAPAIDGGGNNMNQVLLFGVVVALLIGTLAVVMASSRRRRVE